MTDALTALAEHFNAPASSSADVEALLEQLRASLLAGGLPSQELTPELRQEISNRRPDVLDLLDQVAVFGPVLHVTTRAELLACGALVDATSVARAAGFSIPVALTATVWRLYVEIPSGVTGQDEEGRLWDIVWMARVECSRRKPLPNPLPFIVFVRNDNRGPRMRELKLVLGAGDAGEPVATILLPEED